MPCVSIAALLLLALAAPGPDFSGAWKLNLAKSDFGPNYPAPKSRTDKIDHRDPNLNITVTEQFANAAQPVTGTVRYTTDGKPCINQILGNPLKATANWDGDALVIDTWGNFNGSNITLKDRWSLSRDGRTLTVNRHFEGPKQKADQVLVFEKDGVRSRE
jgi:hypothetical protein